MARDTYVGVIVRDADNLFCEGRSTVGGVVSRVVVVGGIIGVRSLGRAKLSLSVSLQSR